MKGSWCCGLSGWGNDELGANARILASGAPSYNPRMRRIVPLSFVILLASCRLFAAKQAPAVAPTPLDPPLTAAPALTALDAAGQQAAWKEAFGPLRLPAKPLETLQKLYATDLLAGMPVSADRTRRGGTEFAPSHVTDGSGKYWATDDDARDGELFIGWGGLQVITHIALKEVPALGARVRNFAVDARIGGQWQPVFQGSGIGARKILRLERPAIADALRIRIRDAAACPALLDVSAYRGPTIVRILPEAEDFLDSTVVRMEASQPGTTIRYTLDGSTPTADSSPYNPTRPPKISQTCLIQAAPFGGNGSVDAAHGLAPATAQVVLWPESKLQPASSFTLPLERGLNYACYEMDINGLAALRDAEPTYTGTCDGFNLNVRKRNEAVAMVYEGWIQVPADGLYRFSLADGGGAQLKIGDAWVVDHDGPHASGEKLGRAALRAGWHPIHLAWFNNVGEPKLDVKCFGPGCPENGEITAERLGR